MTRRQMLLLLLLLLSGPLAAAPALADDDDDDDNSGKGSDDDGDDSGEDDDDGEDDDEDGDDDDHEDARHAVEAGAALSLKQVLAIFHQRFKGTVVDVTLRRSSNVLHYRIKFIDGVGRVRRVQLDAVSGASIN